MRHGGPPMDRQRKLFLSFYLDEQRYVIAVSDIVMVRPLERARVIPGAPHWVAGLITHGGLPVPLIDLSARALGRPARWVTSTRVVLVNYIWPDQGTKRANVLGIILEQVTETIPLDSRDFVPAGVHIPDARYLGPVTQVAGTLVQWLRVEDVLDDDVRACLHAARTTGIVDAADRNESGRSS